MDNLCLGLVLSSFACVFGRARAAPMAMGDIIFIVLMIVCM